MREWDLLMFFCKCLRFSNKSITFALAKGVFDVMSAKRRNQNGCQIITSIWGNFRKTR